MNKSEKCFRKDNFVPSGPSVRHVLGRDIPFFLKVETSCFYQTYFFLQGHVVTKINLRNLILSLRAVLMTGRLSQDDVFMHNLCQHLPFN